MLATQPGGKLEPGPGVGHPIIQRLADSARVILVEPQSHQGVDQRLDVKREGHET